jgi:hypothetical protein
MRYASIHGVALRVPTHLIDRFIQVYLKVFFVASYQVIVVTTHEGAPEYYHGAKVVASWR